MIIIIPCNVYLFFFSSIVLTLINLYLFHVYRYPYKKEKVGFMKEILVAITKSSQEFRQSLLESIDMHLVEAVKSDIFWSCGLNPGDSASTIPPYYPGQNQLGRLLEHQI